MWNTSSREFCQPQIAPKDFLDRGRVSPELLIILAVAKGKSLRNLRNGSDQSVRGVPACGKSTQLVSPETKRRTQFSTQLFAVSCRAKGVLELLIDCTWCKTAHPEKFDHESLLVFFHFSTLTSDGR
jgi:hypothetical protein